MNAFQFSYFIFIFKDSKLNIKCEKNIVINTLIHISSLLFLIRGSKWASAQGWKGKKLNKFLIKMNKIEFIVRWPLSQSRTVRANKSYELSGPVKSYE